MLPLLVGLEQFIETAQPLPRLAELVLYLIALVPREASLGGRSASLSTTTVLSRSLGGVRGWEGWGVAEEHRWS